MVVKGEDALVLLSKLQEQDLSYRAPWRWKPRQSTRQLLDRGLTQCDTHLNQSVGSVSQAGISQRE